MKPVPKRTLSTVTLKFFCENKIHCNRSQSLQIPSQYFRGENVEEAFLETAKKIYQNIQDGR